MARTVKQGKTIRSVDARGSKPSLVRNAFNKVSDLPAYRTLTDQFKRR